MSDFVKTIDVRSLETRDKHNEIINTFNNLSLGETMEIINDYDLRTVHYQFLIGFADKFQWEDIEEGPEVWRVAITKK